MSRRDARIGISLLVSLGVIMAAFLVVGAIGPVRPEFERLTVSEALGDGAPADRYGDRELRIVGWYAELADDCEGSEGDGATDVAWLAGDCPLRVLVPAQPDEGVTQRELERDGVRLTAPSNRPFPSRAEPGGPNLRLQQLIFIGHFDDPAAAGCLPEVRERCRNAFVVSDYDGLLR